MLFRYSGVTCIDNAEFPPSPCFPPQHLHSGQAIDLPFQKLHINPPRPNLLLQVLAASMNALACLVLGHTRNAAAVRAVPGTSAALGLALEQRADAWEADYDTAAAVLAVHTLVLVLGHMACNSSSSTTGGSANGSTGGAENTTGGAGNNTGSAPRATRVILEGPDTNLVDGAMRVVVYEGGAQVGNTSEASSDTAVSSAGGGLAQRPGAGGMWGGGAVGEGQKEAVYVSLAESAKAIGVKLPPALPCARKDGSCVLAPIQIAELRCVVGRVLLLFCVCARGSKGMPHACVGVVSRKF